MAFNVSGWGTVPAGQTLAFGYIFGNGDDHGAQFAMGKPEGALQDGSSNGALVSFNAEIDLDVASQAISILSLPHAPIQSTCRWPCITMIRSA
jgi:hypothetical protein